ncbi:glycosyltransferase family 4 protein [Niallia hominis]|uniref:Glycosyltransferase family 4 protein n=1 Tax=Niallia hominis TaxID=3133173 RepID=A0ABV1EUK1_9BACI
MNILITLTNLAERNGGVCTHVVDLCKGLKEKGHSVWVISAGGLYVERLENLGIEHFNAPFQGIQKHPLKLLKAMLFIKHICKKYSIDIIHTHGQSQILLCQILEKLKRIPFVWTNHIDAVAQPKLFKKLYNLSPFPIISVSTDLKEHMVREFNFNNSDIKVVLNGISFEDYKPLTSSERLEFMQELNIADDEYIISLVGRIAGVKGHQLVLEAMKNITKIYPDKKFKLLFPGAVTTQEQKTYVEEKKMYAENHGININFCGFQNVRKIFGISNLAILPSYKEGFGLVCVEGFAMRCPYIRSDSPGASDMRGISLVFKKGNVKELEEKIIYTIEHPAEIRAMVESAYSYSKKELTKERMVEKTIQIYEEVIVNKI